jgi:hypothetical protein
MKLTRVRLKTGVQVDGQTASVLSAEDGWSIELTDLGVQATRGDKGVGAPFADVVNWSFEVPQKAGK